MCVAVCVSVCTRFCVVLSVVHREDNAEAITEPGLGPYSTRGGPSGLSGVDIIGVVFSVCEMFSS